MELNIGDCVAAKRNEKEERNQLGFLFPYRAEICQVIGDNSKAYRILWTSDHTPSGESQKGNKSKYLYHEERLKPIENEKEYLFDEERNVEDLSDEERLRYPLNTSNNNNIIANDDNNKTNNNK